MLDKLIKTCLSIPLFMRIMLKNREQHRFLSLSVTSFTSNRFIMKLLKESFCVYHVWRFSYNRKRKLIISSRYVMYMFKFSIIYLKYLFVHKVLSNSISLVLEKMVLYRSKIKETLAVSTCDYDNWGNKTWYWNIRDKCAHISTLNVRYRKKRKVHNSRTTMICSCRSVGRCTNPDIISTVWKSNVFNGQKPHLFVTICSFSCVTSHMPS